MLNGKCLCGGVRIELSKHTFVGDKGDYYQITDGLPQNNDY